MRTLLLTCCLLAPGLAAEAADGAPPAAEPTERIDPSLHVEARGEMTYRTRDLDALMLVARRYLGRPLDETEERSLRRTLAQILVAGESLLPLLEALPAEFEGQVRDHLVLDLLAYRPGPGPEPEPIAATEAAPVAAAEPAPVAAPAATTESSPVEAPGPLPPATTGEPQAPPAVADAPPLDASLIALAPLNLSRRGGDGALHRLSLQLALRLAASDDRERILAQLPLIQDACITAIHGLGEAALLPPDPGAIKAALTPALQAAVPAFSGEVLITALESAAP